MTPYRQPPSPESHPALERWANFVAVLHGKTIASALGTEDIVAALIDRSIVEDDRESGATFADADLDRLDRVDQRFRAAAPSGPNLTDLARFTDDEPTHRTVAHRPLFSTTLRCS